MDISLSVTLYRLQEYFWVWLQFVQGNSIKQIPSSHKHNVICEIYVHGARKITTISTYKQPYCQNRHVLLEKTEVVIHTYLLTHSLHTAQYFLRS
jgi:hypothetical protein